MLRLCPIALFLAAIAGEPAFAQAPTIESRLVQAFWTYCIATAGEPRLVHAALEKVRTSPKDLIQYRSGRTFEAVWLRDTADPHQRLAIGYGEVDRDSGPVRICQAEIPWGGKPEVAAALSALVALANETTSVISEGKFESSLTRWVIRTSDVEAAVEYRMPTYAGAPGRTLTLLVDRQ